MRARPRDASSSCDSTAKLADVDPVLNGPSHPLDARTRSLMEPRFGHDFSRVRVHSDPAAAASADSLDARAYTVGQHLVFGPGEYRPGSAGGQSLLAHELTHVTQQNAADPMIQRAPKTGPASRNPKLDVKKAAPDKQPPCACLVSIHRDEVNARRAAEALHAQCHYNLAFIAGSGRNIDVLNVGSRDPNELFPRHIFRECVDDDAPCRSFLDSEANQKSKDPAVSAELVQRQFFLAVKECSEGFSLPIVSLHTNVVTDTAKFRSELPSKKKDEVAKIEGRTFVDEAPPAGQPLPPNTLLYSELEKWLSRNFPSVVNDRSEKAKSEKRRPTWKKKIESPSGGLLAGGMTNIFKWCQTHDNSQCFIGDPSRPDNVVWVTRQQDFDKLVGTKANVALQTRVTPGESETDLSSMFVGDLMNDAWDRLKRTPVPTRGVVAGVARDVANVMNYPTAHSLGPVLENLQEYVRRYDEAVDKEKTTVAKRQGIQFVNVETPQKTKSPAERLAGYRDVRSILQPLGLHCCDAAEDSAVEAKLAPPKKR